MYKGKKILGLIPARGGSKGIPGKNIRPLLGKPLIAWTINQAKNSKFIDKLVVSTDSPEIADVSHKYGAQVPFMRPKELADDDSPGFEAILHALNFLEQENEFYDVVVLLECTSPMRYEQDIDNIIKQLVDNKGVGSVVGVVKVTNEHPLWCFKLTKGYLAHFIPEAGAIGNLSRQLLEDAFLPYSIYATWCKDYKKNKTFYQANTLPYYFRREQKVDIDDEVDFYLTECILKKYLKREVNNAAV